jgi:hypothetical protein
MFVLFKTFLLLLHLFPSISSLPFSLEILSPLPYTQTNSNLTIKLGFNADASKLFDWYMETTTTTTPPHNPYVCISLASLHFAVATPVLQVGCLLMFDVLSNAVQLSGALDNLQLSSVPYGEHDLRISVHLDTGQTGHNIPETEPVVATSTRFLATPIIHGRTSVGTTFTPRHAQDHLKCPFKSSQPPSHLAARRSASKLFSRAYLPLLQQQMGGSLSVGVLVHRGQKSFANSVQSWFDRNIHHYMEEMIIYLQEWPFSDNTPRELVEVAGQDLRLQALLHTVQTHHSTHSPRLKRRMPRVVVIGAPMQVNIAPAFARLVETCTTEMFMFLEEDFVINQTLVSKADVKETLMEATHLLMPPSSVLGSKTHTQQQVHVNVVRLRSKTLPGVPNCANHWRGREKDMLSVRSSDIANHKVLEAAQWLQHSTDVFSSDVVWKCQNKWLCAWSTHAGWTNNPFMAKTEWLLNAIVPIARVDWTRRIESAVNLSPPLWDEECYVIASGEGLFTHKDEDRILEVQSPCASPRIEGE